MTQVFFYHGASDRVAAACALIAGAWNKGKLLHVYAPDAPLADGVDRLLWTRDPLAFVPHCLAASPLAAETPILIATRPEQLTPIERLMNLSNDIPPAHERFANLIEVVGQDEDERRIARDRVRRYREMGCEVSYFDLSKR